MPSPDIRKRLYYLYVEYDTRWNAREGLLKKERRDFNNSDINKWNILIGYCL